jgi:hypothetical protein
MPNQKKDPNRPIKPSDFVHQRCPECKAILRKDQGFNKGKKVCKRCERNIGKKKKKANSVLDELKANTPAIKQSELTDEQKEGRCPDCGLELTEDHECSRRGPGEPDPPPPEFPPAAPEPLNSGVITPAAKNLIAANALDPAVIPGREKDLAVGAPEVNKYLKSIGK